MTRIVKFSEYFLHSDNIHSSGMKASMIHSRNKLYSALEEENESIVSDSDRLIKDNSLLLTDQNSERIEIKINIV